MSKRKTAATDDRESVELFLGEIDNGTSLDALGALVRSLEARVATGEIFNVSVEVEIERDRWNGAEYAKAKLSGLRWESDDERARRLETRAHLEALRRDLRRAQYLELKAEFESGGAGNG